MPAPTEIRIKVEAAERMVARAEKRLAAETEGFAQLFPRFGRHLNYRGRAAVDAEIKLLGTVHNINKLINHTPKKRP